MKRISFSESVEKSLTPYQNRFIRGFFAKAWYINVWHVLYAGGALAVSGLGAYAACMALMSAFQNPQINSFSCTSPLDLNAPSA